jgi:hypothetical protein
MAVSPRLRLLLGSGKTMAAEEWKPSISVAVSSVEPHPSMEGGNAVVAHDHPIPSSTEEVDELVDAGSSTKPSPFSSYSSSTVQSRRLPAY